MKLILRGSDGQQDIFRDIASLESIKVEDDLHTAQLNKLVENLESSLESYKCVFFRDIRTFILGFIFRSKAEEAELMADHNLNLFRRKQQELEELEEKIKNDEQILKVKTNK